MDQFTFTQKEIDEGKVLAGVSYLGWIGFLIGYLVGKENRYTLYHAQQALALCILSVFIAIPFLGWFLISLAVIVLLIIGLINGFGGKVAPLPIIGQFGFKFGLLKADQPAAPQA
jgi:uncharacterized membrane protein